MKIPSVAIALAVSFFLGSNAVAGPDQPLIDAQQDLFAGDDLGVDLTPTLRIQGETARSPVAMQVAKADNLGRLMKAQDADLRRQLTSFVRKHKSASEIGYPATAKVASILSYEVVDRGEDTYRISIRYMVTAAVDTATFEDIFVVQLGPGDDLNVIDLAG